METSRHLIITKHVLDVLFHASGINTSLKGYFLLRCRVGLFILYSCLGFIHAHPESFLGIQCLLVAFAFILTSSSFSYSVIHIFSHSCVLSYLHSFFHLVSLIRVHSFTSSFS